MKKAAESLGIPVFSVSGKDISLPGYNEGFIGGAGGSFEDTLCLFGSPEYSESACEILEFCNANSLRFVALEEGCLTDRGGVKFVRIAK